MNKKDFNNISMVGRYAYALLCIEKLFSTKHKDKNFKQVFSFLWRGTKENVWDSMSEFAQDLTNDFLFASQEYDQDNFIIINQDNFKEFYTLFDDMNDISNKCFKLLFEFLTVYENTGISGFGKESIDILFELFDVLKENDVSLPSLDLVNFSKFSERNGWGNNFDGSKLSIVLNK